MAKILILENDSKLDESKHHYVCKFLRTYEGERIDFSNLGAKSKEQIWGALNECTDIITQTCFVNGSDYQFYQFLQLLKKIKEPKNIYIYLMGSSLYNWFDDIDVKDLYEINHHNIFELEGWDVIPKKLSFAYKIIPVLRAKVTERTYGRTAQSRPTGMQVRILRCLSNARAAEGLPIGEVVDVLDMSEYDPNPNRGVWVWGKDEPMKLLVDSGYNEYEIVSKIDTDDMIDQIYKMAYGEMNDDIHYDEDDEDDMITFKRAELVTITRLQRLAFTQIIENDEWSNTTKANMLCEEMNIPKRGNRVKIANFLSK